MSFNWDITKPANDDRISDFPANERARRTVGRDAIDVEHDEAKGYHKFSEGDETARGTVESDMVDGSIWLATGADVASFVGDARGLVVTFYNGTSWVRSANVWKENVQRFTAGQYGTWVDLDPAPVNIVSDWNDSNFFSATLIANHTLMNPLSRGANQAGVWTYMFTQGNGGGWTLTLDTEFDSVFGTEVPVTPDLDAITILQCVLKSDTRMHTTVSVE